MSVIADILTGLEALLKADPALADADVEISPGRFDASELMKESFRPPALRIAFLGAPKGTPRADGTRRFSGAFGVFVVTDGRGRHLEGIELTETVTAVIEDNSFPLSPLHGVPENLRLDALYTGEVDDRGVSLHAVTWTQPLHLGRSDGLATAPDLTAIIEPGVELSEDITIDLEPGVSA